MKIQNFFQYFKVALKLVTRSIVFPKIQSKQRWVLLFFVYVCPWLCWQTAKYQFKKKTEFDVKLRKKVKKTGKLSGVCQNDQNKERQSKQKKFKCQDFDLVIKLNILWKRWICHLGSLQLVPQVLHLCQQFNKWLIVWREKVEKIQIRNQRPYLFLLILRQVKVMMKSGF